jgi:predicted metal-dependent hydrolase
MIPVIALAGMDVTAPPVWLAAVRTQLEDAYTLRDYDKVNYVTRLIEDHVALALVDGDGDDWQYWTATPKSSPASRRIPIFLIATSEETRQAALTAGADLTLSPDEARQRLPAHVADFARVYDPERAEQLDCECDEPLPPLAEQGFAQFNAGEFYAQHDSFEELWVATEGPVRDLYRAILQVGVAYYQVERGNYRGALKMLLRSVQWLTVLPDTCQGIDVAALRADSYRVRAELERLGEERLDEFDRALLQPVKKA